MPRYAGPSKQLTQTIKILIDRARLAHLDEDAAALHIPRAEAARRAFDLLHFTISSQKPTDATMQSIAKGEHP